MAKSTVAVRFTGDVSSLKSSIGDAEGRLSGFGSKVAGAGKAMALGLGVGVAGAVALGSEVLSLGGKLAAWRQKTDTVFEGQAATVRKWADSNNEAFGLTDDELAGLAASFGDLLKPMGFTADQAAEMSQKVIGLSGALSAWSGGQKSAAEVSEILAAAMLGETDSLKSLGIAISAADIDARLAAKGQKDLTGAALEQAKAMAIQELIFEKSTDAQKAFAEGGNEALSATNRFKAGIGELKERIADGLLPAVLAIASKVAPVFDLIGQGLSSFIGSFTNFEDGITSSGVNGKIEEIGIKTREVFEGIKAWVEENWPKIRDTIVQVVTTISEIVQGILTVIQVAWENFGNNILEFIQRVWPAISLVIEGALNIIQGIVKTITALIQGDWSGVWEGIKQIVAGVWAAIQGLIRTALEVIRGIVGIAMEVVGSVIKGAWNDILAFFQSIPGKIKGFFSGLAEVITAPYRAAFRAIKSLWNSTVGGFGFEVPSWIPGVGGKGFHIPNMHTGGIVPGGLSNEPLMRLQGGEGVFTRDQMAALGGLISGRAAGGGGTAIHVHAGAFAGAIIASERDAERWVVEALNRATSKGLR